MRTVPAWLSMGLLTALTAATAVLRTAPADSMPGSEEAAGGRKPPPAALTTVPAHDDGPSYPSPTQVVVDPAGWRAYVVNQGTDSVAVVDVASRELVSEIPVGRRPIDAAISTDGASLYVACHWDYTVDVVDLATERVVRRLRTGFEPTGLALSPDGSRLSVANTLAGTVSVFSTADGALEREVAAVGRAPRYLAETPDGRRLVVGNAHSRDVTLIDTATGTLLERRSLDRGAQLREIAVSADGRWAFVAGLVSHDEMITMQMERGWINSNALYVLDLDTPGHFVAVLMDDILSGGTNPWAVELSPDGSRAYVSLAGIHQVAMLDLPALLNFVRRTRSEDVPRLSQDVEIMHRLGILRRVDAGGLGPRGLAVHEPSGELLVADYFSDALSVLDATDGTLKAVIPLGPVVEETPWRRGELRFNDGRVCFENWYSCSSCHEDDATMDSLNWDLINDGIGNPKNAKSMHNGAFSAPTMWSGVRADQNTGVMAGQRFLGFLPDREIQTALMAFLGEPRRAPNPFRSSFPNSAPAAIAHGEKTFYRARCDVCHPPPFFTDRKKHDIGLRGYTSDVDFRLRFDTPSLLECYRTGPYLHDGRAGTLRSVFTDHNPRNLHGLTRGLPPPELDDLVSYLRIL